jgi:hypothetical protein
MNAWYRKRPRRARRTKRRAAILMIGCMFTVSGCLLCGLTVDVGNICVSKAELQRCSDAAALASSAVMLDKHDLNGQPNPSLVASTARTAACDYVGLNPCRSVPMTLPRNDGNSETGDLILGRYNAKTGEFDTSSSKYNSAYVFVRRDTVTNGPVPLYFGGLIGLPAINANGEAAAYIETDISGFGVESGSNSICKLLPFSLQIDLWQDRASQRCDDYTHDPVNQTVSAGPDGIYEINLYPSELGPGNFGTIDIGNPNNATPDLSRQILYGPNANDFSYFPNSTIQLDENGILTLNGDTGISAAIKDELNDIIGQPRILPLHATMRGNGNNAYFDIVAFVGITILDAKLTGAMSKKYVTIQPCYTGDGTAIGGGNEGETSKFIFVPPRLRKTR